MVGSLEMKEANTSTAWVKKTYQTKGQDPLGVQAPSIHIYGELLPGITNATDRARYYSFYPWLIWAYEQQSRPKNRADLQEWVRRSDCLFTMVAVRHRIATGDEASSNHEQALVGRDTLGPAVSALKPGEELRLSHYAVTEDENPNRYFKNPLGGLAQYYLGTLDALDLMTRSRQAVANIDVGGSVLAQKMDLAVNRLLFASTVWTDIVTTDILDALSSFCPRQLPQSPEEHSGLSHGASCRQMSYRKRFLKHQSMRGVSVAVFGKFRDVFIEFCYHGYQLGVLRDISPNISCVINYMK